MAYVEGRNHRLSFGVTIILEYNILARGSFSYQCDYYLHRPNWLLYCTPTSLKSTYQTWEAQTQSWKGTSSKLLAATVDIHGMSIMTQAAKNFTGRWTFLCSFAGMYSETSLSILVSGAPPFSFVQGPTFQIDGPSKNILWPSNGHTITVNLARGWIWPGVVM